MFLLLFQFLALRQLLNSFELFVLRLFFLRRCHGPFNVHRLQETQSSQQNCWPKRSFGSREANIIESLYLTEAAEISDTWISCTEILELLSFMSAWLSKSYINWGCYLECGNLFGELCCELTKCFDGSTKYELVTREGTDVYRDLSPERFMTKRSGFLSMTWVHDLHERIMWEYSAWN